MKEIKLKKLDVSCFEENLENGLKIVLLPFPNKKNYFISYGTYFGADITTFTINKKEVKVPDGIAHFLEHKMFEQEDGIDPFSFFSESGTGSNASTSYEFTQYICYGNKEFPKNLRYLLHFVNKPYYTDENVEKEKGIIAEELKMYEDIPDFKLEMRLRQNIYNKSPRRIDIGGTVKEVNKITKEDLYLCYDNFYTPSNMAISICGDFDPEKILEEIKKRITNFEKKEIPKRIYPDEQEAVFEKEKCVKMDISNPLFSLGFKDKVSKDQVKKHIAINIILNTILGKSSKLNKELTDEGLILGALDFEYEFADNYAFGMISGVSRNPREVIKRIKEEIENQKKNGLNEADFTRNKKKLYGSYIAEFNSVEDTARLFLTEYFRGVNGFDYLEKYKEVTKEYAEEILKDLLKEENFAVSIVE